MSYTKKSNNNYITMTGLNLTENLGSQMNNFASLYCIARRSGHRIVFFKEHIDHGKKLQLQLHFKKLSLEIESINNLNDSEKTHNIFPIDSSVTVDSRIFNLEPGLNYNFVGLFNSYKNWYQQRSEISNLYTFDEDVINQAKVLIEQAQEGGKSQVVSVHVRRTDYLNEFHNNLTMAYYEAAFKYFDDSLVSFLIFSDDIPWCRANFPSKANIFYSIGATPIIDMAAMSLCNHNIIANSSFSFWSAFLNKNNKKIIICPEKYLKNDKYIPYINYAWYPDEFIGIDIGNA